MSGNYNQRLRTFDKLKKTFECLVAENIKLQDKRARVINPYEQKLSNLTRENQMLKELVETKMRVEGDEYKEFVKAKIAEYEQEQTSK